MLGASSLVNIYISREGAQSGPFSEAQVHSMLNAKLVAPDDLAWQDGQASWEPIRTVLGLAEPPPLRSPPPRPAAQANTEDQLRAKMRKKTALSGVGGWLTFFCVGLTILGPLYSIGQLTSTYEKAKPALDRVPILKAAVDFETGGSVAILIYGFIVGCIIWSGSPSGRRIARQFLLIRLFGFIGYRGHRLLDDFTGVIRSCVCWCRLGIRRCLPRGYLLPHLVALLQAIGARSQHVWF